jgi:tetratricopeptide (TPR) repeat protein
MNEIQKLIELDVSDSMKANIEALFGAMDTVNTSDIGDALEKFTKIHTKVAEIEEYFWRPVDSKEVYERLIVLAKELGDEEKSTHYKRQIDLSEANDWEFKGRVQEFYGNKIKALEFYSKALELIADHELAFPAHEKVLKSIDRARSEIDKWERKLQSQDDDPKLWFKYGIAQLNLGDVEKAIECLDRAIELDSTNPDAYARRGCAMESLGNYTEAKKYFEKALELKPTSMIAKRGMNYAEYFLEH